MELEMTLGQPTGLADIPVNFPGMEVSGSEPGVDPFRIPYDSVLCLEVLFQRVEAAVDSPDFGIQYIAKEIMRRVEQSPELRAPIEDLSTLEKYKETIELIMLFIIPPTDRETKLFRFSKPFGFIPVYMSPAMVSLMSMKDACFSFSNKVEEVMSRHIVMVGCHILRQIYGVDVDVKPSAMLTVPDAETGLRRFYKPTMDESFIQVITKGEAPKLGKKQIQRLLNNISDTDLWLELLPPEKFAFHGLHISHLTEVTEEQALSRLKHRLISRDAILDVERVIELADLIRVHFQNKDLQLGLTAVDYPNTRAVDHEYRIRFNFLSDSVDRLTQEIFRGSIYDQAFQSGEV